jgi:hypothetical protein
MLALAVFGGTFWMTAIIFNRSSPGRSSRTGNNRAINQVTLCMFQLASGNEFFAVDGEFGAHPIRRQRSGRPVNENKTGDLAVGRKNFKRSIRTQPPGKVRRQTKGKMRLRKLKLDSGFVVNPALLDVFHCKLFSTPESWAMRARTPAPMLIRSGSWETRLMEIKRGKVAWVALPAFFTGLPEKRFYFRGFTVGD